MPVEPSIDPFPGLRPFEANEGHLFFGREGQSEEILRLLRRHRFLAVVGSSGSGKSSLVRAGLLPYLYGGFLAQAGSHWRVAIFRPGSDPLRNLAGALDDPAVLGKPAANPVEAAQSGMLLEVSLRRSGLGLIEVVRLAGLPEQEQVLVIVDQFEELFRFAGAVDKPRQEDDAAAFVKLLLEASGQCEVPIYIVLTMRSDFIGDCARFRGLPEAVTTGLYLIPRMTREQRRLAIVEPVRVGGGSMAPRLVNRLLNDVGDDPDQLPILQHALMRTWNYWKTHDRCHRPIDVNDYLAIGGMAAALSQHADESYDSLPDDRHRAIARRIFQALSEKGPDYRETRRPTSVETLAQVEGVPNSDIIRVLEEFRRPGRSFLMPPAGVALEASSVVDISHESLIRGWQRLRQWVDEEMESAMVYRRLAETAGLHAQGTAGLWHDPDLQHALAWREKERPTAAWGNRYHPGFEQAMAFLERSRAVREGERRKQESSRRRTLGNAIAALVVVTLLAIVSLTQWREAVKQQQAAQQLRDRAGHAVATFIGRLFSVSLGMAIEDLDKEIKLDPTDPTTYFLRAILYSAREDYDRAIADLNRMIELDPGFTAGYLSRGSMYESKKDYDRAIADYDQALKLDTKNTIIYNARGWAYHLKLDYDRAIADYDEAIKLNPNYATAYNNRGLDYNNKKDYDRAIADLDQAIKLNPNYATAYSNRGLAYHNKGDHDRAIADYDQAIRLDAKFSLAYNNRGFTYYTKKDYDRAIADYGQAIRLDANYAAAYNNRGAAYRAMGNYDRAIADLDQAIKINPNFGRGYYNRGNVHRAKGQVDQAIADYAQGIKLDPQEAGAYSALCWTHLIRGELDSALADCNKSLQLRAVDAYALDSRGFVYLRVSQPERALADFDAALQIESKLASSLYGRGLAKLKKEDHVGADADMAAAKAIKADTAEELARYGIK